MTCYLMEIVIFTTPFGISRIFTVYMCMTLTQTFRVKGQMQIYQSKAPIHNLLLDGNSNFYPITISRYSLSKRA